jgi:hypothetical protein
MAQMGHATPGFTLAVYAVAMKTGSGDRERLRRLVEGGEIDWSEAGRPSARGPREPRLSSS